MNPRNQGPFLFYNLFPRLVGPFSAWRPHLERARDLGFNWIYVNPVHQPGSSGSLYSIADYHGVNRELLAHGSAREPWEQVRDAIEEAHALGLRVMVDLVVNHMAFDSPMVSEHPSWFERDENGALVHPGAWQGDRKVVWDDLAEVANASSGDREALWTHWRGVVTRLLEAGFDGLRCEGAYQSPTPLWHALLGHARSLRPDVLLAAETLGCPDWQVVEVARLAFDLCFNSAKWWDFHQSWCLDQYRATAAHTSTVAFPESHDTPRLMAELDGDVPAVKLRYLFTALFSSGVMMPIGFEYGFRRPLDVARTRPSDWEGPRVDLTGFVREVNALKCAHRVFQEDNRIARHSQPNPAVVVLEKTARDSHDRGLLVLNTDRTREAHVFLADLNAMLESPIVRDVTPGAPPTEQVRLTETLPPAGFRVFVSG